MAAGYAAQLFGLAEAAIDALVKLTTDKPAVDAGPALGERPVVMAALAEQRTRINAARRHLQEGVARLWAATEEGAVTPALIAEVYGAAHHGMAQGRAAVDAMYSLAGASALYTSSPLERIHRDVHAMAAHVIAQPLWLEDTGRVMLGLKPVNPLYLV
jgi:alkylation response protein AidB-like acyl-CoA dehydrogenase